MHGKQHELDGKQKPKHLSMYKDRWTNAQQPETY